MQEFGINTRLRKAAFLAQVMHESGGFQWMQELGDGEGYTNRADLGNTDPVAIAAAKAHGMSTGAFYKGHCPIQITGYKNHKLCGEGIGLDLVNNPTLITEPKDGCRAAAWFWRVGAGLNLGKAATARGIPYGCDLNDYADNEKFDDITVAINGGFNGKEDRDKMYTIARGVIT